MESAWPLYRTKRHRRSLPDNIQYIYIYKRKIRAMCALRWRGWITNAVVWALISFREALCVVYRLRIIIIIIIIPLDFCVLLDFCSALSSLLRAHTYSVSFMIKTFQAFIQRNLFHFIPIFIPLFWLVLLFGRHRYASGRGNFQRAQRV